jgi:flagellar hook-basal body complex protein FliE
MTIEAMNSEAALLQKMHALKSVAGGDIGIAQNGADQEGFIDAMKAAVARVNADQNSAARLMTAVDTGQSDDLVGAMVASQKAGLSFSALMQVRNKLMSGFDDIMRLAL